MSEIAFRTPVTVKFRDGTTATGRFYGYDTNDDKRMVVDLLLDTGMHRRILMDYVRCIECNDSITDDKIDIELGMSSERFKALLEELDGNSVKTLAEKNARYSQNGDALHNFRSGAEIVGGTPAQACWGYMTKHLVALRDMVQRNDFSNREDFLEKCQDTINYIRFLWCIGNDEYKDVKSVTSETFFEEQ